MRVAACGHPEYALNSEPRGPSTSDRELGVLIRALFLLRSQSMYTERHATPDLEPDYVNPSIWAAASRVLIVFRQAMAYPRPASLLRVLQASTRPARPFTICGYEDDTIRTRRSELRTVRTLRDVRRKARHGPPTTDDRRPTRCTERVTAGLPWCHAVLMRPSASTSGPAQLEPKSMPESELGSLEAAEAHLSDVTDSAGVRLDRAQLELESGTGTIRRAWGSSWDQMMAERDR